MLAAIGEEIRRSNMRLRLANNDLAKELASKDELIRKIKESHEAKLWKVWEEAAVSASKEVVRECRVRIDCDIEAVEEARRMDKDRLKQLRVRVKSAWRSVKEIKEELDSWWREEVSLKGHIGVMSVEKEKMRDEKERFANKVVSL